MHRRGYGIILGVILLVGIGKETYDALRLGWHHTSILDKVGTSDARESAVSTVMFRPRPSY
jgi:hypothetical protein